MQTWCHLKASHTLVAPHSLHPQACLPLAARSNRYRGSMGSALSMTACPQGSMRHIPNPVPEQSTAGSSPGMTRTWQAIATRLAGSSARASLLQRTAGSAIAAVSNTTSAGKSAAHVRSRTRRIRHR